MSTVRQVETDYLVPFNVEVAPLAKTQFVGFCTSKKCCRYETIVNYKKKDKKTGEVKIEQRVQVCFYPEVFKMMVERRTQMAERCLDCGSTLFWTRK